MPDAKCRRALALLALLITLQLAGSVRAQVTDGRWLVGVGTAPLAFSHATTTSGTGQDTSAWHAGIGGEAVVLLGRGVGSWTFALEFSVAHDEQTLEAVDITSSASLRADLSQTRLTLGPNVRYLFIDGDIRPFAEAGVGFGVEHSEELTSTGEFTTLYARAGPGVQLGVAELASLDLLLRAGYAASSGQVTLNGIVVPIQQAPIQLAPVDMDVAEIEVALVARLSIWL